MKFPKILVAIALCASVFACKKDQTPSGGNNENTKGNIKSFYSLQNKIAAQFQATLSDTIEDEYAHSETMLAWILQQPEVAEAVMHSVYAFDVKAKNGFSGNIIFTPKQSDARLFTRGGGSQTNGQLQVFKKANDEKIIDNKNVLVVAQYASDFYAPYCKAPDAKHIQKLLDLFEYADIDFNVTVKVNEGLSAFLDLSDYGIIIFNTHGTPTGLASGEDIFSTQNLVAFSDDVEVGQLPENAATKLRSGELKLTSFWEYEKATQQMTIKNASYELTFSFFQSLPVKFDNTVLIGNYCYSGIQNGIMGDILEPKGLKSFYGYGYPNGRSYEVTNELAWRAEDTIISNLITRDTTGIAHLANNTTLLQDDLFWQERMMSLTMRKRLAEKFFIFGPQTFNQYLDKGYKLGNCSGDSIFTDTRDGQKYKIVKIADQWWFAENLRYSGAISEVSSATQWEAIWNNANPTGQPAWCYYDNDASNNTTYGKLYNWYAANSGTLCPSGWHVPTNDEWQELVDSLGGTQIAGGKLKAIDKWQSPNTGATNEVCFSAYPGGRRALNGNFGFIGASGVWWTTTSSANTDAKNRTLSYFNAGVISDINYKTEGYSCRCVQD